MADHLIAQFTPVIFMMGIIGMNHFINNQRADRRTAAEASRLRAALAAELRALLDIYKKNLQLIEKRADHILSTRSSVIVYRGSVARLTMLLEDPLIEQIVGVFAQNERIETVIAARSNFKCGLTYQFPVAEAPFDEWKVMFMEAAADVSFVCRALEGHRRASPGGNRRRLAAEIRSTDASVEPAGRGLISSADAAGAAAGVVAARLRRRSPDVRPRGRGLGMASGLSARSSPPQRHTQRCRNWVPAAGVQSIGRS